MKKKGFLLMLSMLMVLSIALAGCSSSENGSNDSSSGNSDDGGSTQKTLVFGRGGDSVALDPAIVTDGESFKVTKNIFDTLVTYGDQDTSINEGLATEWKVSDDGLKYTLKLREGVKFHDGTDFNADAVVYNFDRWMNAGQDQKGKFAYYASMFGGFKGDEGHVIKEVKAVDDYTVEFTLNRPQAPFLKNLAMSPFAIASPDALEKQGDKFGENPVGTGPFKFKEWKRNDRIVVEKNEDYWMDGYPKLDRVIFRAIPDNSARLNALKTGEIDLMDGVNPSDVEGIKGDDNLQVFFRPSMNVGYLGFNVEKEPFNNKKVRQALNHAVDKQALIDAFYEGQAEPAKNPLPPVIEAYNDEIEKYEFDLDKAKKLLEEAGYPDGFKMDLWAMPVPRPYMPDGKKIAEAIQANFKKIGVDVNIVSYEWATYLEKAQAGEAPAFLLGWTGDNGDADNFLYVLLDQDNIGSNNYSRYSNAELHEILVKAQSTPDEEKRKELYKKAQEIIHEDAPWVPLVHSEPALGGKSNIKGFTPHPTGSDYLTKVYFE
ncbi:ABC transporter substrate-binding protein [Pseudalkalibacillus caeni]|uniref:ABC transporter substrate-binding protein n=1 Tax=Exobacillus caeni TaxID=2574798 RepID=A0A5R9F2G6_9BACL|nr:ABC transporter substrate-binding protein [Pseudalkalibacillus caeni]TLS35698.1 ABC transporter substrate-binding protein [Pseudalkalibacillus caeni]